MRRLTMILVAVLCAGAVAAGVQKEQSFPHTKKNGRATVEYRHEGFQVVINYDYSQRSHSTAWLLIDLAAASKQRFVLHRDNVTLVMPDGRVVPVAPQQALIADSARITTLVQNASVSRQQLDSYFTQRDRIERITFQVVPITGGVSDEAIVDNDRVTMGQLFFKSPEGKWADGTYGLVIDNDKAKAALPVSLQ